MKLGEFMHSNAFFFGAVAVIWGMIVGLTLDSFDRIDDSERQCNERGGTLVRLRSNMICIKAEVIQLELTK